MNSVVEQASMHKINAGWTSQNIAFDSKPLLQKLLIVQGPSALLYFEAKVEQQDYFPRMKGHMVWKSYC